MFGADYMRVLGSTKNGKISRKRTTARGLCGTEWYKIIPTSTHVSREGGSSRLAHRSTVPRCGHSCYVEK